MDRLDRKILAELQSEGRLSLTDLASRVGLTVSPARWWTSERKKLRNGPRPGSYASGARHKARNES